jgi:hypothetical protein
VDAVHFVRLLSQIAARYGMATGLKNAMDVLTQLRQDVAFAVNEECAIRNECHTYEGFDKPVYHIEYPPLQLAATVGEVERKFYCVDNDTSLSFFRTVLKAKKLDGLVEYCNGDFFRTPTKEVLEGNSRGKNNMVIGRSPIPVERVVQGRRIGRMRQRPKRFTVEDVEKMRRIAKEDGYPFAPGKGSDAFISNEDLHPRANRIQLAKKLVHRVQVIETTTLITQRRT